MLKLKDNFVLRVLGNKGTFMGSLVVARNLSENLAQNHKLSQIATYYAAEGIVAALLISADQTKFDTVTFRIEGDGALRGLTVDCSKRNQVRMMPRSIDPDISALEKHYQKNQSPYGDGMLQITRQGPYAKVPSIGTTALPFKGLAQNLTYFLSQSEQIQAAVGLYVELQEQPPQPLKHAWGFLVKKLPNTPMEDIEMMEKKIQALRIEEFKNDPRDLFNFLFEDNGFTILEEFETSDFCTCSKERYEQALKMLSPEEIKNIASYGPQVEIVCEYCKKKYLVDVNVGSAE